MSPLLLCDYYKTEHFKMYPKNMTKLYSNFTPRKSRMKGVNEVVFFGLQHFVLKYIIEGFNHGFFIHGLRSTLGTEKAAKNYIKLHKPCLSYSDVIEIFKVGRLSESLLAESIVVSPKLSPFKAGVASIQNMKKNLDHLIKTKI